MMSAEAWEATASILSWSFFSTVMKATSTSSILPVFSWSVMASANGVGFLTSNSMKSACM